MRNRLQFVLALLLFTVSVSAQTLPQSIYDALKSRDGGAGDGKSYSLTTTNSLPAGWLLQTPNVWGVDASKVTAIPLCHDVTRCEPNFKLPYCSPDQPCTTGKCVQLRSGPANKTLCVGQSDQFVDEFYDVIAAGGTLIDVATLDTPNWRFLAALRNGVTAAAKTGKPVFIRVAIGEHPLANVKQVTLRNELIADARNVPGSKLKLVVMVYRYFDNLWPYWNHSKIVANDSRAVVGGHNLWTNDYLVTNVVHDLSMKLDGPAATSAHRYLDVIWNNVCKASNAASFDEGTINDKSCLQPHPLAPQATGTGSVAVLGVGNYSYGHNPTGPAAFASDYARDEAIRRAKKSIVFSQQDIGMGLPWISRRVWWPDETLKALGDALIRGVDVTVVLSNFGATGGSVPYEYKIPPIVAADKIAAVTSVRPGAPSGDALINLLCRNLHMATLRFNDKDDKWPATGAAFANHAKSWLVDDKAFYIGSDNVYPAWLQEYGYIVEDPAAVQTLRTDYLDPLWKYSKRTAISGGGEGSVCQLRCEVWTGSPFDAGHSNKPRGLYDVNGDGKADYCRVIGKDRLSCAIAQASSFGDGAFRTGESFDFGWDNKPREFTDVNGDGKADYCRFIAGKNVLSCALSTGTPESVTGSFNDGAFKTPENFDPGWSDQPRAFIDVNGDGKTDFCRFIGKGGDLRISCQLATATGWNGGTLESAKGFDAGWNNKPKFFTDINGNGKSAYCRSVGKDVLKCAVSNGSSFVDASYASGENFDFGYSNKPRGFADANGDHKLDYCRVVGDDKLSCAITGDSGFTDGTWISAKLDFGWADKPRTFADVNGDGKADYCRVTGGNLLRCATSSGEGTKGTFNDTFEALDHFDIGDAPRLFGDVIGDAAADYCRVRNGKGLSCAHISVCHK